INILAMDALIIASVFQRYQVKKQISILSFAQRGKPPKKARLGTVNTLEEEMVEEEETVQVEEEETVQVEEEEIVQVEEEETVQVEEEETVEDMVVETVAEMARTKGRKVPGAATYKTSFNSEIGRAHV